MTHDTKLLLKFVSVLLPIVLLIVAIFLYLDREPVYTPPTVSAEILAHIVKDYHRLPHFVGVTISAADVASNSRYVIFYSMTDPILKEQFRNFFEERHVSAVEPLFVRDGDEINMRTTQLMNHEIVCSPYSSTVRSRYITDTQHRIASVCSIAVPPVYGEFIGILTVFLGKVPTDAERELINIILLDTADDIAAALK